MSSTVFKELPKRGIERCIGEGVAMVFGLWTAPKIQIRAF